MKILRTLPLIFVLLLFSILPSCIALGVVSISRLHAVPEGWSQVARPDPAYSLRFHLCLRPYNVQDLEDHLLNVSHPGHESYGRHLAGDAIQTYLKPANDAKLSVEAWLKSHDVVGLHEHISSHFTFSASVEQAEALLSTKFHVYRNDQTGRAIVRTLEYLVPASLSEHLQMIQPTTRFEESRPQFYIYPPDGDDNTQYPKAVDALALKETNDLDTPTRYETNACNISITPGCLRGLYGLENVNITHEGHSYSLGIAGFLNQYARVSDWAMFKSLHAPWVNTSFGFTVMTLFGTENLPDDQEHDSIEAQLDIQYAMAIAPYINTLYILVPGLGPLVPDDDQPRQDDNYNEPYLDQLLALLLVPSDILPRVISYSYGENEQSVPFDYASQVCTMFGLLSLRGVSVIFASGDSGPGGACTSNVGLGPRLNAQFPASCPWVTSVGGTTHVEPEAGVAFSSGGFSDYFPTPKYQEGIPQRYLSNYPKEIQEYTNISGRAFPDVAAQAARFHIVDKGVQLSASGTSASAPVFAAVVANLNRIRWRQGKAPLGFLNPWLYSLPEGKGLTDIVDGHSRGCFSSEGTAIANAAWKCTTGWDAVTGLGTPRFEELVEAMP